MPEICTQINLSTHAHTHFHRQRNTVWKLKDTCAWNAFRNRLSQANCRCCSLLQCVAVCYSVCSVLQCLAVRVLQCVVVLFGVLQCATVCYSVLQYAAVVCYSVLQCVAVCCSALQGMPVRCNVLQRIALYAFLVTFKEYRQTRHHRQLQRNTCQLLSTSNTGSPISFFFY